MELHSEGLIVGSRIWLSPDTQAVVPVRLPPAEQNHRTGVPDLHDLMPNDLRWSRWNNNTDKVHKKCDVLKAMPPTLVPGETVFYKTGPWSQRCWGRLPSDIHRETASAVWLT